MNPYFKKEGIDGMVEFILENKTRKIKITFQDYKMNINLLGFGSIGKRHLKHLLRFKLLKR